MKFLVINSKLKNLGKIKMKIFKSEGFWGSWASLGVLWLEATSGEDGRASCKALTVSIARASPKSDASSTGYHPVDQESLLWCH